MENVLLPVKTFVACSEDEDVEDLETTDFEEAKALLEKIRDENPNQSWSLVADLEV